MYHIPQQAPIALLSNMKMSWQSTVYAVLTKYGQNLRPSLVKIDCIIYYLTLQMLVQICLKRSLTGLPQCIKNTPNTTITGHWRIHDWPKKCTCLTLHAIGSILLSDHQFSVATHHQELAKFKLINCNTPPATM